MVLCLFIYFLVLNFDWSIILIRKSFGASRHISGKLGVKLAIAVSCVQRMEVIVKMKKREKKSDGRWGCVQRMKVIVKRKKGRGGGGGQGRCEWRSEAFEKIIIFFFFFFFGGGGGGVGLGGSGLM